MTYFPLRQTTCFFIPLVAPCKPLLDKVYDKVMESIETVIVAVEHKIDNIYQVATMDTVAKANALQKIMGQDGYTKGDGPLKH